MKTNPEFHRRDTSSLFSIHWNHLHLGVSRLSLLYKRLPNAIFRQKVFIYLDFFRYFKYYFARQSLNYYPLYQVKIWWQVVDGIPEHPNKSNPIRQYFCFLFYFLQTLTQTLQKAHQSTCFGSFLKFLGFDDRFWDFEERKSVIWLINTYNAEGVSRPQVQNGRKLIKKYHNSGIWWLYLESPWEMHANKYKHAW